jgi:hypothetical protein
MVEKYSLLEIMKDKGISRRTYRKLSDEINARKREKTEKRLLEELRMFQENK